MFRGLHVQPKITDEAAIDFVNLTR
jgi:hypothetical protein